MPDHAATKRALYAHCQAVVQARVDTARRATQAAQAAANAEGKSSAGDKYETTRAMMQIERDLCARQLEEALKMQQELARIDVAIAHERALPGSVVITDRQRYFLAVGVGKVSLHGEEYLLVSVQSPVGVALRNRRAGESLTFLRDTLRVVAVW